MEEMINNYKDVDFTEKTFVDLTEQERKILVQRFIDQVIYDAEKFKVAVKLLEKWENNSEQSKTN